MFDGISIYAAFNSSTHCQTTATEREVPAFADTESPYTEAN